MEIMMNDEICGLLNDLEEIAHSIVEYGGKGLTENDAESVLQAERMIRDSCLWTPVKDKYPEDGQRCIVTLTMSYDGREEEELATYYGDGEVVYWGLEHDVDYSEVTAWRPAPEPYRR